MSEITVSPMTKLETCIKVLEKLKELKKGHVYFRDEKPDLFNSYRMLVRIKKGTTPKTYPPEGYISDEALFGLAEEAGLIASRTEPVYKLKKKK